MKEIKEEANRRHEEKLEKYGCGGRTHRAHGGKVEHEGHPHEKKDKHLAKEIKHEAEEIERDHEGRRHGGHVKHRDMGGPIAAGGGSPRLGRGRKGAGKKGTNVNVMIGKPGGDGPVGLPPALGAGPGPGGPAPMPPKPMPAMPPRPMPAPGGAPAGPMKRGGKVEHKEHEKKHERHHERKEHEHRERENHSRHSGHRG